MSHYSTVQTKIKDKASLARALVNMGYKREAVEVFDSPTDLYSYTGSKSGLKGEIRIRKGNGKNEGYIRYNDLGFERAADGTFIMHADGLNDKWRMRLERQYSREVIKDVASKNGFFLQEDSEVGEEIFLKVQSPF